MSTLQDEMAQEIWQAYVVEVGRAQPRLVSAAVLRYPIQVAEDAVINKLAARFNEDGESREEGSR